MRQRRTKVGRHRAYDHLRSQIIRVELPPGSMVSENEIAATLGLSRTPVREALLLLAEGELIEVIPQIGTFVSRVDLRGVREAQFLREAVELASLRSLLPPFDQKLLDALRVNLDEQDKVAEDGDAFFELDEEFHKGLMALANHEASWATVVSAKGHLDRARRLGIQHNPSARVFVEQHREIFNEVCAGDVVSAEESLRAHLRVIFDDIQAIHEHSPHLFVDDPGARPARRSVIVWE